MTDTVRHPHETIDLCSELTGYDGGWCDSDFRMLYACFQILCDFVKLERGLEMLKYQFEAKDPYMSEEGLEYRRQTYEEVFALHHWWTVERPARRALNDIGDPFYAQDTEMLLRLIKIRQALWT